MERLKNEGILEKSKDQFLSFFHEAHLYLYGEPFNYEYIPDPYDKEYSICIPQGDFHKIRSLFQGFLDVFIRSRMQYEDALYNMRCINLTHIYEREKSQKHILYAFRLGKEANAYLRDPSGSISLTLSMVSFVRDLNTKEFYHLIFLRYDKEGRLVKYYFRAPKKMTSANSLRSAYHQNLPLLSKKGIHHTLLETINNILYPLDELDGVSKYYHLDERTGPARSLHLYFFREKEITIPGNPPLGLSTGVEIRI
ncbi:MAG: hypothetical protein QW328_07790 [Nitrososphaerota archaeon]